MDGLPVLMYHAVSDLRGTRFAQLGVPPHLLEEQLTALARAGYRLLGLTDALRARAEEPSAALVALTFDDAYDDFAEHAAPLLRRAGAGATLYVPTAHVGGRAGWLGPAAGDVPPLMTWSQLADVAAGGVEVGSHSHTHPQLDLLGAAELEHEVLESRRLLQERLDVDAASFCYPHGYHAPAVRAAVVAAGYDNACEVGRRTRPVQGRRFSVSRLAVGPRTSPERLLHEVRSGGPLLEPLVKRALTRPWRSARRARARRPS